MVEKSLPTMTLHWLDWSIYVCKDWSDGNRDECVGVLS